MTTTVFVTVRYDTNSDTPAEVLGVYLNHESAVRGIEEFHEEYLGEDTERVAWGCNGQFGSANDISYEIFVRPVTA